MKPGVYRHPSGLIVNIPENVVRCDGSCNCPSHRGPLVWVEDAGSWTPEAKMKYLREPFPKVEPKP